ncbi:MAG: glycosyltransferase [Candidatus Binatia bacterium]
MIDRIIVLCRSLPARTKSSGELRFAQILDRLRGRGREVLVFAEMEMNRALFPDLPIYDMSLLEEKSRGGDLAFLEFWYMDLYVPILRRQGVPVIVDSVDIEFLRRDRQKRLLGLPPECYQIEKEREVAVYRQAEQVWAVSTDDAAQIAELNPRIAIVPNIFDRVENVVPFAERRGVCFVGSYSHQPNVDGLRWYRDAVLPRVQHIPHTIIGHDAPVDIRALPGFIGGVASSVEYVRRARVSIAPVRYGAGLKGKVLEAMACGTPVVTTPIGDEGYAAGASRAAIVTDDPEAFAAAIERLHADQEVWETMARNGRALAARYAPDVVGQVIDAALTEVLRRRRAQRLEAHR